ncbi:putative ABC transporter [Trypanosoma grayi]|uniref:putative ABC transporter n=1 Tax=Trypanosoma grayi TaxID=71804 RepID=UPI0004F4A313|nr:putative ABC transporter [Trypanosoma grayi]KEG07341.1 putative ABC transporter [Trypanosoma grayi]
MGLRQSVQYIAWFIIDGMQYAVVSLIVAVLMKVTFMTKTSFGVLFFLFFLFTLTLVALSGLIGSLFSKARLSAVLAPLIYFLLSTPLFAIGSAGSAVISALCILSPSAFSEGLSILFDYEISTGFKSGDLANSMDSPNMIFILIMLVVDLVVYLVLMLYLDAVVPNDWGTPKHPLFCILAPLSWCCKQEEDWSSEEDGRKPTGVFEPLTDEELSRTAVRICGLTKAFKRGKETFVAVDHMHWDLVEGEISVLLGHNGAGKTTLMNMMTGMMKPKGGDCYIYGHSIRNSLGAARQEIGFCPNGAGKTTLMNMMTGMMKPKGGDCYIYGHSIRNSLGAARQEIGFCPQHNILWPDLTCHEHLTYFSSIKGLSGDAQKEAIEQMLEGVDLQDKRDYASSALSGGQKRKLSVAIAFVGGSRLIFLDEPTAGMDVGARRHTWDLLRRMSADRTILLSTHFMDEADLLGDRIAIMSKGRMQCAGSGLFLKSNLGVGYNITMSVTSSAERQGIDSLIRSYVPAAEVLNSGAGEVSYRLPMSFAKDFPAMLADVESSGDMYGVQGYTLSATTLEEIFLRIAHGDDMDANTSAEGQQDGAAALPGKEDHTVGVKLEIPLRPVTFSETSAPAAESPPLHSVWDAKLIEDETTLMGCQFKASFLKRCRNALRDRRTQFIQILFPVIMVIFAMLLNMIDMVKHPSIRLSSDMYEGHVQIDLANCANDISTSIPFARDAETSVLSDIGNTTALSAHLVGSYKSHATSRYTAMACGDPVYGGATALFFNMSALHGIAVSMVGYYGAVVQKALSSASVEYLEDIFVTENFPMIRTNREEAFRDMMKSLLVAMLIMIPFSFVPSTFVSWVVRERECKARHLQNVSGLRFSVYWLSNYVFDICSYLIMMLLVMIVMLIFGRKEYVAAETFGPTFVLFVTYGLSCIAMSYALSFLFKEHSSAQNTVMLGNFLTGFLLVMLVETLVMVPSTEKAGNGLKWAFRLFPSYCVGEGIVGLASRMGKQNLAGTAISPWALDVVGGPIIYMVVEIPAFFLITLFIDHPTRRMRTQMLLHHGEEGEAIFEEGEEEDVAMERRRVMEGDPTVSEDLVRVVNLRKVYSNGKVAVRNVTFGVKPGEVFGFLGTNGAGKTTTIAILCQEMVPTSGQAFICGKDTVRESREALRYIGYCPQFDALLDLLTVEEHLQLYAGIRGVVAHQRKMVTTELMQLCELTEFRRTRAGELSGGNKRKLSVALALIGGPRVVFLDEPSAGMDPVARRGLWTAVQAISSTCSVVLTTHHLEEVEALAHRVAIMVDGTLRCLGNKTHLKTKYGSGFEMTIRTHENVPASRVEEFIRASFPDAKLDEMRGPRFTYALPPGTSLAAAFGVLERNKEAVGIADYAVSQTSIEQVFLRISEEAQNKAEDAAIAEQEQ